MEITERGLLHVVLVIVTIFVFIPSAIFGGIMKSGVSAVATMIMLAIWMIVADAVIKSHR